MAKIYIIDVTNRDGVQTPFVHLSKIQKTLIILYLKCMGVTRIECGFPNTKHEIHYLNAIQELDEFKGITLIGWIPTGQKFIEGARKKVPALKHLTISISTSKLLIETKWPGKAFSDILKEITEAIKFAKVTGFETIGVTAEDASRTELERLIEFGLAIKEAGADRMRYADTMGCDDPLRIYQRMKKIAEAVKIPLETHCHNDLGMAVANTVAGARGAIEGGVDVFINTTINGVGERTGNADFGSGLLAINFEYEADLLPFLDEKIKLRGEPLFPQGKKTSLAKLCKYVSSATGIPIPFNQPGVGSGIFSTASGIHGKALLKDRRTYELYEPEEVGREEENVIVRTREIIGGAYSGKAVIEHACKQLGIELKSEKEAEDFVDLVGHLDVHVHNAPTGDELRFVAKYPEIARQIMTMTP